VLERWVLRWVLRRGANRSQWRPIVGRKGRRKPPARGTKRASNASTSAETPSRDELLALLQEGEQRRLGGHAEEAVRLFRQVLAGDRAVLPAWLGLTSSLRAAGEGDEALQAVRRALDLDPEQPASHNQLGLCWVLLDDDAAAIASSNRSVELAPEGLSARFNLVAALRRAGDGERALAEAQALRERASGDVDAWVELGVTQHALGRADEAISSFEHAVQLDDSCYLAHLDLGNCLHAEARLAESESHLRRAVALRPTAAEAQQLLANGLKAQGRLPEALAAHREALVLDPSDARAHSNWLLTLHYVKHDAAETEAAHREWARQHAPPLSKRPPARLAASAYETAKLRVGYLSPDMRAHSVAYFLEPRLRGHDRENVELFGYSDVARPDAITGRLRKRFDHWCDASALDDAALLERIRRDDIDVLVELAGHTGGNRLKMVAERAAPLQLSYIGYPANSRLDAIDARLSDERADPPTGAQDGIVRLNDCFLCYQPDAGAPEVTPAPLLERGQVTFGSFNALPKISDEVVACWSAILTRVPDARLLLKCPSFTDDATAARYREAFAGCGITAERLSLVGFAPETSDHLGLYGQIDIGLDPFPYNGTTTTCEAMWMGVPVVTLVGDRHAGRVGYSLLSSVGLDELCAHSRDDYVEAAIALAGARERLVSLRQDLRERLRRSPLCDSARIGRELERVYRRLLVEVLQREAR